MRLTLRLLGLDVLDLDLSTDSPSPEPDDDPERDLSGGTLGFTLMDGGQGDVTMGFTNGREVDDE